MADNNDVDTTSLSEKPRLGTHITPRTCLWPLAGSLVITFALSIGLTYRSDHHCYAGTCGEWLFPLQARLHVVIWYMWLSLSVTFLAVRAFHPVMQKVLARPLTARKVPLLGKRMTLGGALMPLWILALYGVVVGVWWIRLHDYFTSRNALAGISHGSNRLAAIALTGHFCDITMGMVLLPISRHSALASFFKISVSTTLTNHILTAYTLFTLVLLHGLLYISWIPTFNTLSPTLRKIIPIFNPTYLSSETWPGNTTSLGIWRASLVFTGSAAALFMLLIFCTTFPRIRARNFNLFYFTHLLSIPMVIIICLHASTMFYCTAPGLAMWVLDWGMRLHELRQSLDGNISALGKGWYCVTLPLPRARLTGCSCRSPLAHFYIHHADSSIRELHPFTTITHLASQNSKTPSPSAALSIQFLFRKQSDKPTSLAPSSSPPPSTIRRLLRGKNSRRQSTQWTDRLARLADTQPQDPAAMEEGAVRTQQHNIPISLRLEGPYFSPADPSRYDTIICLVAGTGVTGAIAIASAYTHAFSSFSSFPSSSSTRPRCKRCFILWSVKASDEIDLVPFLGGTLEVAQGLELKVFKTGQEGSGRRRVDFEGELGRIVGLGGGGGCGQRREKMGGEKDEQGGEGVSDEEGGGKRTWVYISGPGAYIRGAKDACGAVKKRLGREGGGGGGGVLDVYAASWDI